MMQEVSESIQVLRSQQPEEVTRSCNLDSLKGFPLSLEYTHRH